MKDCIFCKIANGEIPSATLYEDEKFRVILDLGPATKGHALILPKSHYENLYELPDALAGEAMVLAKKVAGADFIMYEAKTLPNRFVRKFKKLPLLAWTVRSQEEYLNVVKYCDNVIFEGFEPKI